MPTIHLVVGVAAMALNLAAAAVGGAAWYRDRQSPFFWRLVRVAQGAVVLAVVLGSILLISGREPDRGVHLMYGVLCLVVMVGSEGMRAAAAERLSQGLDVAALPRDAQEALYFAILRRETGVMAAGALLVAVLAWRAGVTADSFPG